MKTLKQISNFFGKYMAVIVLIVAAVSLKTLVSNLTGEVIDVRRKN